MIHHVSAVWRYRHFWMSLVRLDLRSRYRKSVLGVGWSLMHPIAMTVVFCVVFGSVMNVQNWRTFAPSVLAGLAVWEFVRNAAQAGCQALIANESYIRQCPLPFSIYPLRTVLGGAFHFLVSLAVVVVLVVGLTQDIGRLAFVPYLLPAVALTVVFGWAVATVAAFATVYFHDTSHIIEVGAQLMFFLTPIIYPPELLLKNGLELVYTLNPVNLFLDMVRLPVLEGVAPPGALYAKAAGLTAGAVAVACGVIAWLQKKVIFQM